MDILNKFIERELSEKRPHLLDEWTVGLTSFLHLMYLNDVLIFSKANTKSFKSIIIGKFTQISGLEVNTTKVCEDNLEFHIILGFTPKSLPITYLGLPITMKEKSFNQCWKLIQSIVNLLVKWSEKVFIISKKNPIGLLNHIRWIHILDPSPIPLPSSIIIKVRKLAYQFVWDGRKRIP